MKRADKVYEEAGDLSDNNDLRTTAKVEDYETKVEDYWIEAKYDFVCLVSHTAADGLRSPEK